jgi:hypothetical protein
MVLQFAVRDIGQLTDFKNASMATRREALIDAWRREKGKPAYAPVIKG